MAGDPKGGRLIALLRLKGSTVINNEAQTNSTWMYGLAILLVLVIGAGGLYLALTDYFSRGELGTKDYYAILQGVEFDNRGSKDPDPILKENANGSGLNVLGVRGADAAGTRVWIVLNRASADGQPLLIPQDVPVKVDCEAISDVISGKDVVDAARRYFLRGCVS